jgi:NitT/TauT family transport system substrate-binding protein
MTRAWGAVRFGRLAVPLLTVIAVAGCGVLGGSDEDSGGNAQVEQVKVRVGIIPQIIDIAGFERAQQAGYFRKEGLEVEVVPIKSATDAVPQLKTGDLDFAVGNWVTFIQAQAKKTIDLRFIADALQAKEGMSALCAMPDSGITTPQDLAGKAIGVNALRGNVELSVRAILQANGVDANTVEFKVVPISNAINALQTKQIDVMSLNQPNLTTAKQKLGVVAVADRATGPMHDFPVGGYAATAQFARENPKTVAAVQRAIAHGQSDVADRQVLEDTLLAYTDIDEKTAKAVVATVGAGTFPAALDKTNMQRVSDLMDTYDILPGKFDIGPMIHPAPPSS